MNTGPAETEARARWAALREGEGGVARDADDLGCVPAIGRVVEPREGLDTDLVERVAGLVVTRRGRHLDVEVVGGLRELAGAGQRAAGAVERAEPPHVAGRGHQVLAEMHEDPPVRVVVRDTDGNAAVRVRWIAPVGLTVHQQCRLVRECRGTPCRPLILRSTGGDAAHASGPIHGLDIGIATNEAGFIRRAVVVQAQWITAARAAGRRPLDLGVMHDEVARSEEPRVAQVATAGLSAFPGLVVVDVAPDRSAMHVAPTRRPGASAVARVAAAWAHRLRAPIGAVRELLPERVPEDDRVAAIVSMPDGQCRPSRPTRCRGRASRHCPALRRTR